MWRGVARAAVRKLPLYPERKIADCERRSSGVHCGSLRGFIQIWCELNLVPERGLEPPLPCENQVLNLARLPIPPFGHKCGTWTAPLVTRVTSFFILPADLTFVNELS